MIGRGRGCLIRWLGEGVPSQIPGSHGSFPNVNYPNEPDGMTPVAHSLCDFVPNGTKPDGWTNVWAGSAVTNVSVQTDATAPINGPSILRIRYPTGLVTGTGPCNFSATWNTGGLPEDIGYCNEIFFGYSIKVVGNGTNFEGHSSGINKMGFFSGNNASSNDLTWAMMGGGIRTTFGWHLRSQTPLPAINYDRNVGSGDVITVGQWHKFEGRCVQNTVGVDDGILQVWWDEVLTHNHTNVRYRGTGAGFEDTFRNFTMNPTWGGAGGADKSRDDDIYFSDFYISGKL